MELIAKLGAALLLGTFIVLFLPRARQMMQESKEAESDWKAAIIPLAAVVGFVVLLVMSVR